MCVCVCVCVCVVFHAYLYKNICSGYPFELHNSRCNSNGYMYLYKEVDKKYTGYNLKTMELLDCGFIGVCAIIRMNMVLVFLLFLHCYLHFPLFFSITLFPFFF